MTAADKRSPMKIAVLAVVLLLVLLATVFMFAPKQGAPALKGEADVEKLVSEMSTRDKICQMMVVHRADAVQADNATYNLDEFPYAGIIYYDADIACAGDIPLMLANDQAASEIGLFTTIDEEGGNVSKLAGNAQDAVISSSAYEGCTPLFPMYYYKNDGPEVAYENAEIIGTYLRDYGFNWNLAPVSDTMQENFHGDMRVEGIIGTRCYSDRFDDGALLVAEAVKGYESTDTMTCLKHFPGQGATDIDSHYGAVTIDKSLEEMEQTDLLPFASGIEAGADAVMLGHIIVPAVSDEPASTSSEWVDYLRNDMNFDGLIITDGMTMRSSETGQTAIEGDYRELAKKSINAGVDIILTPENPSVLADAIEDMVETGEISSESIDAAVTRVLMKKLDKGIL